MKDQPIIMDRTLDASPERIWKAITDREQMKQWYFDIAEFKPEVGLNSNSPEGRTTRNTCTSAKSREWLWEKGSLTAGVTTGCREYRM